MTCPFEDQLPIFASGQISSEDAIQLKKHLMECESCRKDLEFWKEIGGVINKADETVTQPEGLASNALAVIHSKPSFARNWQRALGLLQAQAYLVRQEMWPASAGVMALGVITVILSKEAALLTFIAPLVAAASLAAIYGPQNDPASELTLATPMSPWKVLLARLTLVSGYNLLLALAASLLVMTVVPIELLGSLILSWLGPLTLLSALALLLSLWIGTSNAITISYGLWIIQYIRPPRLLEVWPTLQSWDTFLTEYRLFWQSPGLLILLALIVVFITLVSTRFTEKTLTQATG
jgi:hypothetical protein